MPQRVYIVEDHAVMRDMLADFLEAQAGLDVVGSAGAGESALDELEALDTPPDLVLIDVSLPGIDGIEVLRSLQEMYDGVSCLMLSGHAEESYVREATDAGARGYVIKGQPTVILEAVKTLLDGGTFYSDNIEEHWYS